jgi:hypothetical protein
MSAIYVIYRPGFTLAACVLVSAGLTVAAQQQPTRQPAKTPPRPAAQPATKAPAAQPAQTARPPAAQPAAKPLSEAEIKAKQQILQSDRWRRAVAEMNEWLSVQQSYSPQQIEKLKMDLAEKIRMMTPAELEMLLARMEAKLDVLLSPDAQAARAWVAQYLSVMAAKPKEEFKKRLPDPVSMTPAQMEQELAAFKQREASTQQAQAAMQQGREQRVQSIQSNRASIPPTGQSRGTGSAQAYFGPTQSKYAPRQYNPGFMRRNEYYVTPWGGLGMVYNPGRP